MGRYTNDTVTIKKNRESIRTVIGDNLKRLRRLKKDKQRDLGDILGTNQPYISAVERGKADIRAYMIPILADIYDVYAESFFNENGKIPFDFIAKLLHSVALEADKDDVRDYLDGLVEQIVECGKSDDLFKMFYVSIKTCLKYEKPMDNIASEMYRAKEYDVIKELENKAKQTK